MSADTLAAPAATEAKGNEATAAIVPPTPANAAPVAPKDETKTPAPVAPPAPPAAESKPLEPYKLKAAEGAAAEVIDSFAKQAHAAGLPADKAQAFLDSQTAELQKLVEKQREQWVEAIKADQKLGGAKFEQTIADANKALARFGSPELVQVLRDHNLDVNPAMVAVWKAVNDAISPDSKFIGGAPPGRGAGDQEATLRNMFSASLKALEGKG